MVLTIIIIVVMLVIAVGLVALYREVGLGREERERSTAARPGRVSWPLGGVSKGGPFAIPSEEPFTGFIVLCSDDQDALGELYSVAVVAEEWGYPLLLAVAKTFRATGWTDRLDGLPGNIGQYELRVDEMQALAPDRLPIVGFVNDGRMVDASVNLDSPSDIAKGFQHLRYGLAR